MNVSELMERIGQINWSDFVEWFGGMDHQQVLYELNYCWPHEDNEELADSIVEILRRYPDDEPHTMTVI